MKYLVSILLVIASLCSADARFPRGGSSSFQDNGGGLNLNLNVPGYGYGYMPFTNWMKGGGPITIVSSVNGTLVGKQVWDCPIASTATCSTPTTYLTSDGELITPVPADVTSFSRAIFAGVFDFAAQYGTGSNPFSGQQFDITWQGCTTPTMSVTGSLGTGGSPGSSFGSNSGTITLGNTNADTVTLVFGMTPTCRAAPPIKIVSALHQYATQAAACNVSVAVIPPTSCWDPAYLSAIRASGVLRFMAFMQTNNSGISDISQLADANYVHLGSYFPGSYMTGSGLSGTTLTVANISTAATGSIRVGSVLRDASGANPTLNITVTAFGTGTGGNGTYTVTCSTGACPTLSNAGFVGKPPVGANSDFGTKGGMHPSIACSLGVATGAVIEYEIPVFATNQMVDDVATYLRNCSVTRTKYTFSNELFNSGGSFIVQYAQAQSFGYATTVTWGGYREAEIFERIAAVYGTASYNPETISPNTTARWWGSFGSFAAIPAYTLDVVTGANQWLATGGSHPYTLPQLARAADIAPYLGSPNIGGTCGGTQCPTITGISVSATPTVTQADHGFTNGQTIYMYVTGGTMASVLTGVYATATVINSSSYSINISTVGKTYANPGGSSTNWATDATLFKMMDQSIALNVSTPATYPTKYSFFAQQMFKSILTGTASDASYGTFLTEGSGNLSNVTGASIQDLFRGHALNANTYGISVSQYEAGYGPTLSSFLWSPAPPSLPEFLAQAQFDTGVAGDTSCSGSPCNITTIYQVLFQAFRDVNAIYASQFLDLGPLSKFGPWPALRFTTDTANPKWQATVTENGRGVNVPSYPSAPGTYTYIPPTVASANESSAATTYTYTGTGFPTSASYFAFCWVSQSDSGTLTSLTIGSDVLTPGVNITQDAIKLDTGNGLVSIYSGVLPAGAATRTVTPLFGSSNFFDKLSYVYVLNGLANNAKDSATNGTTTTTAILSAVKNAAVIGCGRRFGGTVNWSGGGGAVPALAPVVQTSGTQGSSTLFKFNFNSSIMPLYMGTGVGGFGVAASYR